jgi:hypothetical protein
MDEIWQSGDRSRRSTDDRKEVDMRGAGRAVFVAILLLIAGVLNVIYGISALSNTHFFNGTVYAFSTLHTWGWITILVGVIQLTGGVSLMGGGGYGRVIGIIAATLGALESLLSIGGQHPFWSLGVFAICLWVLYGLVVLDTEESPVS